MSGPTSHFLVSQRLRLHYVDWGNRDAPPLLLVHGGRDHCRNWDWVAEELGRDWHLIAPDLRGHGDSQWSSDGTYPLAAFLYDIAHLVEQLDLAPVSLLGHSLGGNICVRYAGIYPDRVKQLIAIEGLGLTPRSNEGRMAKPIYERMRLWIDDQKSLAARAPHRYPTLDEAVARMAEANKHLSPEQARHLTEYGVNRNEDGTYSWKFDSYMRSRPPYDMTPAEIHALWGEVRCPTLLVHGKESWSTNPLEDGRAAHFKTAKVEMVDGAGHWVHHDKLDAFLGLARAFLKRD